MFLQVSVCPHWAGHAWFYSGGGWGACMVLFGGCVWFYSGGVHGFIWGHVWFYLGGVHGFIQGHAWFYSGACMVLFGGHAWFYLGACMVLFGGHAWFYSGRMHGFLSFFGYNEVRSMSEWYASCWNAFLLKNIFTEKLFCIFNI